MAFIIVVVMAASLLADSLWCRAGIMGSDRMQRILGRHPESRFRCNRLLLLLRHRHSGFNQTYWRPLGWLFAGIGLGIAGIVLRRGLRRKRSAQSSRPVSRVEFDLRLSPVRYTGLPTVIYFSRIAHLAHSVRGGDRCFRETKQKCEANPWP